MLERYEKIFGKMTAPSKNIWHVRANTIKMPAKDLEKFLSSIGTVERMEHENGFWVCSEKNLSKTAEHLLGYFFLQNASSMLPPLALNPKAGDMLLDMCASPGAKTTQMAAMMKNEGVIIANDVTHKRLKALRGNLQRCGVSNAIVTKMHGEDFWKGGLKFEKILLDAPCTGTGTMNPRILHQTSENTVKMFSRLQKKLLESAVRCLDVEGTIVYSTCSLEPEENEENVDFAVTQLELTVEKIDFSSSNALTEWNRKEFSPQVAKAVRVKPDERHEGFFICKMRK